MINTDTMRKDKYQSGDFYTINELCDILQLKRLSIYRYIKADKLKAYKFWNELRIAKWDFQAFLDNNVTNNK